MMSSLAVLVRRHAGLAAKWALRILLLIWVLVPFAALFLVSIQSRADALRLPPVWLPRPDFSNYTKILGRAFSDAPATSSGDYIWPGMINSAAIGVAVAVINILAGAGAGYAFARLRVPGKRVVPLAMLATQMVPPFALLIPFFVLLRGFGLTNTRSGVVIALLSVTLPFTVWLLRAYFEGIPVELDRAARMDGCSRGRAFFQVVLPLARTGLIAVGLFAFMVAWNDIIFSIVLVTDNDSMLVQPAIAGLYNIREQSVGIMGAGTILAALPTMLVAMFAQRFLVKGLLAGARKG